MTSQNQLIRKHLLAGGTLTPLDALKKFGCLRLSGRVHDIINGRTVDPLPIEKEMIQVGEKRVARYFAPINPKRKAKKQPR